MPESYPPTRKNVRTRRDAAADRQIVLIVCNHCRRRAYYLPEDLAAVCGEKAPARVPPFPCSRYGTLEYMSVALKIPTAEEAIGRKVRRPIRRGPKVDMADGAVGARVGEAGLPLPIFA